MFGRALRRTTATAYWPLLVRRSAMAIAAHHRGEGLGAQHDQGDAGADGEGADADHPQVGFGQGGVVVTHRSSSQMWACRERSGSTGAGRIGTGYRGGRGSATAG